MLEPEFLGLWTKLNKEGNGPIERAACWIYNNLPRIQNSKFKKNWFPHPKNQPNPKRCHAVYTMESFPIGRTISQNMYLASSKATTASEVKTEAAGEIGDPNLLYDRVSMYLY